MNRTADAYIAFLANCLIVGEEFAPTSAGREVRSVIRVTLSGFDAELRQHPSLIEGASWTKLRGRRLVTTKLIIPEVQPSRSHEAAAIADRVAELLMLATASEVSIVGFDYAPGLPSRRRTPILGSLQYYRPVIDTRNGEAVRAFLERSWPGYEASREHRKLPVAFHYYALAEREGTPIELRLATLFILLEQLKHSFAVASRWPFLKGSFHKPGTTRQTVSPRTRWSFEALLTQMFRAVSMTPQLAPLVGVRNEIFHSGLSTLAFDQMITEYHEILGTLGEYLLRVIGYAGPFLLGNSPSSIAPIP